MTAMLHLVDRPEADVKTESQPEKADVTLFMYYINSWLATHVSVAVFVLISGILERRYIIASIGGLWLLSMVVEMGHACWKEW